MKEEQKRVRRGMAASSKASAYQPDVDGSGDRKVSSGGRVIESGET